MNQAQRPLTGPPPDTDRPPPDSFRERLRRGDPLIGTFLNTGSPLVAEICARAGFDWLVVDLEHGAGTEADLVAHLHAIQTTAVVPIVRVEEGTRLRIGRALDLGAAGIMVPQVQTAGDAVRIGRWLRWPPAGGRGLALFTRGGELGALRHGDVPASAETVVGIVQIETPGAVDAAAEIAAVPEVDALFVGPTDLSHTLGVPGDVEHPIFLDAAARVARAARDQGRAAGVMLWSADHLDRFADLGYTFFSLSSEGALLDRAARAAVAAAHDLVSWRASPGRPIPPDTP